jgi:multicomponent Na+:H+ antiporter subunit A
LAEILANPETVRSHHLYLAIFLLVALGAFTKSAQFPFHFWLPNAMAAPTPVSAYLHSATMVKAGIYLLLRLDALLGGTPVWVFTLVGAGSISMLIGAVGALRHRDLKKVLAYSTITALGTLTLLIGLSFEASIKAAIVFLIVHALYKGSLFLVAGSVDHEAGSRDIAGLGGLRRLMPFTAAAAILSGLSMAGLPPLFGFVGKELAYKAKVGFDGADILLPAIAVLANALTVAAAGLLVLLPFFGKLKKTPRSAHEAPAGMWIGSLLLAASGLVFGIFPALLPKPIVSSAVTAALGYAIEIKLALWYGLGTELLLSGLTIALGVLLFWQRNSVMRLLGRLDALAAWGPQRWYQFLLGSVLRFASWHTRLLQNGNLRGYLLWLLMGLVAATGIPLVGNLDLLQNVEFAAGELLPHEWILTLLIVIGAVVTAVTTNKLLAVAALGAVGFSIALLFLGLGAPDLAMTQFLVETLVVVIILLVLRHLPVRQLNKRVKGRLSIDTLLPAILAGGVVSLLLIAISSQPLNLNISAYFTAQSLPEGFGRNIVNVILVDFRALDTLGEITVLAVAALGAFVLAQSDLKSSPSLPAPDRLLILQTATRLLVSLLLLASLFLLWRGHNEPGGGFIGGLVAAGAFILFLMAYGEQATSSLLRTDPRTLLGTGLAVAVLSGMPAVIRGQAFLSGGWITIESGDPGAPLKLGTPLLFDVGVFLVVVGFALAIVIAMERVPSTRRTVGGS